MSKNSKFITHSPLVQREDFSKYSYPFDELNLLEIQKNSFSEKNLKVQLKDLFEVYFPIMHDKNKKYRVVFRDLSFEKPDNFFSPDEALEKGRSYEKALFVDLGIEDLEMNKCDFIRKDKKNKANGIFFGCIPMITDKGTFIVNGVEKNVLSQIVRSPGLYVLNRSRVKLSSHTNASGDYFCELLANRGSAIHFYVSKAKILKFSIRSAVQFAKSKEYNATLLLKALGLGEDEILEIFNHHPIIVNTLKDDIYQKASLKDDKDFKRHADAKEKNPGSFSLFKTVRELYKKYVEQPSDKILDQLVSE
jgi:DNA-directed RNA polymerase subunit beta